MPRISTMIVLSVALASPCAAQTDPGPLHSFNIEWTVTCAAVNQVLIVTNGQHVGGWQRWPVGAFHVQGASITDSTDDPNAVASVGALHPYGDLFVPRRLGPGTESLMFPTGLSMYFPNDGTAQIRLDQQCEPGHVQEIAATIWYWQ